MKEVINSECGRYNGWDTIKFPVLLESKTRAGYIILFIDDNRGMCVASPDLADIGLCSNKFYPANSGTWNVYEGNIILTNKIKG